MVLERAEIIVRDDLVQEALAALRTRGLALTRAFTGCLSFKAMQCVEHPARIMFLAEWESVETHQRSRLEPAHEEFRTLMLAFVAGAEPTVHFVEIS